MKFRNLGTDPRRNPASTSEVVSAMVLPRACCHATQGAAPAESIELFFLVAIENVADLLVGLLAASSHPDQALFATLFGPA